MLWVSEESSKVPMKLFRFVLWLTPCRQIRDECVDNRHGSGFRKRRTNRDGHHKSMACSRKFTKPVAHAILFLSSFDL